jgi:hypothetical protein
MRTGTPNYRWQCPRQCQTAIDTGVPIGKPSDDLQRDTSDMVEFNASRFFPPTTKSRIATAKVFMPHILHHFIECTRGGCYNSLYFNVLVPRLDAQEVPTRAAYKNGRRERANSVFRAECLASG